MRGSSVCKQRKVKMAQLAVLPFVKILGDDGLRTGGKKRASPDEWKKKTENDLSGESVVAVSVLRCPLGEWFWKGRTLWKNKSGIRRGEG